MKISVITPSFNKTAYIIEAMYSVLNQSHKDIEYILLENSTDVKTKDAILHNVIDARVIYFNSAFTEEQRKKNYPTAVLLNQWLPLATGDLIFYLSDDDYFLPGCFERVIKEFEAYPEAQVVYFGLSVQDTTRSNGGDGFMEISKITANEKLPKGTNMDCMLDGGQVVFRRECLSKIETPYFRVEMDNETAHCDGMFLNKLSHEFEFYNIPDILAVKRRTPLSTFNSGHLQ